MALKRRPNSLLNYNSPCHYNSPEEKGFIDDYNSAEITRTFSYGKIVSETAHEEDDFDQIRSRSFGGVVLHDKSDQNYEEFSQGNCFNRNLKSNPTTPVGNNPFSLRALRSLQSGFGSISSSMIKRFSFYSATSVKSPSTTDKEPKIQSTAHKGWNLLSSPTGALHSKNLNPVEGESLLEDDAADYHREDIKQSHQKDGTDNSNFGWATDANWNLSPVQDFTSSFDIQTTSSSWEQTNPRDDELSSSKNTSKNELTPIAVQNASNALTQTNTSERQALSKQRKRGSGFLKWFSKDKESESNIPSNYGLLANTDDDQELDIDNDSCEEDDSNLRQW